ISDAHAVLEQHDHDESFHPSHQPSHVVWPTSVEEVSAIVKLAHKTNTPIMPYGTGTGLEGGVIATHGGIVLNLTRMDAVVSVNADDFDGTVQPGVTRTSFNNYLRDTGLWFPVDPGADASLCGMAATSASGTNAVLYGTMRENVLNLEVVLPNGDIIHTAGLRGRSPKSAAGYNLTNLFVGSEGTLGIITAATLRLHGQPAHVMSAVCAFPDVHAAASAAAGIRQYNVPIARMELLDAAMIEATNAYSKLDNPVAPHLFLEFHGFSESSVAEQVELVQDVVEDNGGSHFRFSPDAEERHKLWAARHNAWYACMAQRPGGRGYSTDVCVPISALPAMVDFAAAKMKELHLSSAIAGHVGDGNFHCITAFDPNDTTEVQRVKQLSEALARREAIRLDGTCTGEHGIGLGKQHLLREEMGDATIAAMLAVKSTFDPTNIMNPGKVLGPRALGTQ
ncbi:uncharacterized protein MONBRDRAFT_15213, partial [Monosiga brevicollis MX1]